MIFEADEPRFSPLFQGEFFISAREARLGFLWRWLGVKKREKKGLKLK